MKKLPVLIAALAALAVLASGCGTTATYAATVNGDEISQKDVTDELVAIRDNKKYAEQTEKRLAESGSKLRGSGTNTFDAAITASLLTQHIFLKIIHQGLVEKKLKVTAEDRTRAREQLEQQHEQEFKGDKTVWTAFPESYRNTQIERRAEVAVLQRSLSKASDEKAIAAYYNEHKKEFLQTCSRHILAIFPGNPRDPNNPPPTPEVEAQLKAKAQGWKDRVAKGEDFAAIAKAESDDKNSGAEGGDLGCQGGFVAEFTKAMESLQPGQTSDPVRTQFGYHIIQVTSRKQQTLAEVRDQIQQQLEQESQGALQKFLFDRLKTAKIKVNPKYGTWDKGDEAEQRNPGVVPPKGPSTTTTTEAGGSGEDDLPPPQQRPQQTTTP